MGDPASAGEGFPTFATFFGACHGHPPYQWQQRLADLVLAEGWPDVVDAPTGMGKTAAVDVAVYALAHQTATGQRRTAPMRIFHVIERRIVVDGVSRHVQEMADRINGAVEGDPLLPVRRALSALSGSGDEPAVVVAGAIHGARRDDRSWLRATGCTVVSMTAHQFVSRLLFRGIGVSTGTRPIHAALVGVDRLVLFDEPHLASPAVNAIRDSERIQRRADTSLAVPVGATVLLGATIPPEMLSQKVFRLDPANETSPEAQRRLSARRAIRLEPLHKPSESEYPKRMATSALEAWASGCHRVGVIANTVAVAQEISQALESKRRSLGFPLAFMTSTVRDTDRDWVDDWDEGIVVSTQVLEVGVDIDFDTLITEAAPLASLVQRIGRLNRDGRFENATATVFFGQDAGDVEVRKATAWIYEEAPVAAAIELLVELTDGEYVEFDLRRQLELRASGRTDGPELWGTRPRSATLQSGLIDLMAQTRPTPRPDIPIEAFIAGPDAQAGSDVLVAWRSDLDLLDLCPPLASEQIALPRHVVRAFLDGHRVEPKNLNDDSDDRPTKASSARPKHDPVPAQLARIKGDRGWIPLEDSQLRSGTVLVLDSSVGGYDPRLGWRPQLDGQVMDHAVIAALKVLQRNASSRARIPMSQDALGVAFATLPEDSAALARERLQVLTRMLDIARSAVPADVDPPPAAQGIAEAACDVVRAMLPGDQRMLSVVANEFDLVVEVGDRASARQGAGQVELADHLTQVAVWAREDAKTAGLSPELYEAIGLAGFLHDSGKDWPVYQLALGNDRVPPEPLVAKSVSTGLRGVSQVPPNWRHEARSLRYAREAHAGPLVEHIVGAHHGWNRPVFPDADGPDQSRGASESASFAALNRKWGPWGLAYLETVMRLADWKASQYPVAATRYKPPAVQYVPAPAPLREEDFTPLPGLTNQPLLGWSAVVGLLDAAEQVGDSTARIRWEILEGVNLPIIPTLATRIDLRTLVERILDPVSWEASERLVDKWLSTPLTVKNQRVQPPDRVRPLLLDADAADDRLLQTLLCDVLPVNDKGKLAMPTVLIPNNSSYPRVALEARAREGVEETLRALLDPAAGWTAKTNCDGGLDRGGAEQPAINGIGRFRERVSRAAMAPLVLRGLSALGANPSERGAVRIHGQYRIRVPFPTFGVGLDELRTLRISAWWGRGASTNVATPGWYGEYELMKPSDYELVWTGGLRKA